MRLPRISIIIPTFNEESFIGQTLEHVLALGVFEIIVVDGESTDRTCEIVSELGVKILHSGKGRGLQMNVGAAAASGEILLFSLRRDPVDFRLFYKYPIGQASSILFYCNKKREKIKKYEVFCCHNMNNFG